MLIKSLILAATLSATVLSHQASAAELWTVTTHGTIFTGTDSIGTFGQRGLDLAGLEYTQSITTSIDPAKWSDKWREELGSFNQMKGSGNRFVTKVTVNGVTVVFDVSDRTSGEQYVSNISPASDVYDEVSTSQSGYDAFGQYVFASQYVASTEDIVSSLEFDQSLKAHLVGQFYALSEFVLGSPSQTRFYAFPDFIEVVPSDIPEPASLSLVGLGFLALMRLGKKSARTMS